MTLHIIDPFKRTTYLCSNESHPLASSQQVLFSLLLMDNNSWSHFYILTWKMHSGSSLGDTDKWVAAAFAVQSSVKDLPLRINRLVLGPVVGQTDTDSTLYYCVSKTHTCTQILSTHLIRQKSQTERAASNWGVLFLYMSTEKKEALYDYTKLMLEGNREVIKNGKTEIQFSVI